MKTKTCGECQWYDHHHLLCVIGGDIKPTERAKDCFVSASPTNGDRVRQMSNRELAELLDEVNCLYCPYENKENGLCNRPAEKTCIDGIEAWLNAPAESEGEDE
jgi:hypothetical protein